ncbi:Gfo/Idh/MocA family oxidoreductase [Solibacillus sp. FSL W7-1464]|uniref:Gfo/Idh/MocA family protein n=1 Tax=Solibacillus sp. FSL W7-1464 TaxID=2921706 RepID=UPI0030FA9546
MVLRWGIIGAATIAKEKIIPAILKNGGSIQAIASFSRNIDGWIREFDIKEVYREYEALLKSENIEAVYIALPNSLHYTWTMEALKHNKHVLVEKPIVLDVEQMQDIKRLAEKENLVVMEAFMYRFHPQIKALKEMMKNKEIGDIVSMSSNFHFVLENWKNDIRITPNLGGGVLYDIGCYCINIQQYILGEPVKEAKFITERYLDVDVKISGVIQYMNGIVGHIDCSFSGEFTNTFKIIGSEGVIHLPHAFRSDIHNHLGVIEVYKEQEKNEYYFEGDAYQLQIENFEQAVRGKKQLYSLEEMLAQTEALTKLYKII